MGISGSQHAVTPSRAKILRAGGGRSGWPVQVGVKVKTYALSGIARSGATRSNYHSGHVFISVGGIHYGTGRVGLPGVLIADFEIEDTINETPSTCGLTCIGFVPAIGADVVITLGSKNNNDRDFAGTVLSREYGYASKPANWRHRVTCIDYTWGLNTRKITERYLTTAVGVILQDLLTKYAPPAYTSSIVPELAATVLDEITYTNEDLTDALTRLMRRVGGNWYCDYNKVIRAFYGIDPSVQPPGIINAVNPSLLDLDVVRDLSQYLTRVYVEGGGANAYAVPPGAQLLPVQDPSWYPSSGVVVSGPQRIRYTGVQVGGGGSLVGPGAAPSQRPIVGRAPGVGMADGQYYYSFTYVTALGESKTSPAQYVILSPAAPPTTMVTVGAPKPGIGPDTGLHDYSVTFLTATGETTPGPTLYHAQTTEVAAPEDAPTPEPAAGAGLEDGDHAYAVSFVTQLGETLVGPIGPTVRTGSRTVPSAAPTVSAPRAGNGPDPGAHQYALTFEYTDNAETPAGPLSATVTTRAALPKVTVAPTATVNTNFFTSVSLYTIGDSVKFSLMWINSRGEAAGEGPLSASFTAVASTQPGATMYAACFDLSNLEVPTDPQVAEKWIYLWVNGTRKVFSRWAPSVFSLPAAFNASSNTAIGVPPFVSGASCIVDLSNLQIAPVGVGIRTRNLYRTPAGSGQLKLVAKLSTSEPQVTTYTDTKSDASLGVNVPTGGTTATSQVKVTNIATGPAGAGVQSRNLYRRDGGGPLKKVDSIAGNSTKTYIDTKPAASLGVSPPTTNTAVSNQLPLSDIPTGEPGIVIGRAIYRTRAWQPVGNPNQGLAFVINDNTTKTALDTVPDASLGAPPPTVSTANANQAQVTGIAVGGETTISRNLYRTAVNDTTLKLRAVIGDNTTTTFLDNQPDAVLGTQQPPTSDTSGLAQPPGVVMPGNTSLIVASTAAFSPAGGVVVIGNGQQVIRYTGIAGNALVGIPPSGPGSISASVSYSSTATVPPTLTGIPSSGAGAIKFPIPTGDPVNLWVQVDDLEARAALAALLGTDGIVEDVLSDNRLSYTEAHARGLAHLQERASLRILVKYRTRDRNTGAGTAVTINLGEPINLAMQQFLIQRVIMSALKDQKPVYEVEASSTLYAFEELLRLIRKGD